jgi:hypothetical protein
LERETLGIMAVDSAGLNGIPLLYRHDRKRKGEDRCIKSLTPSTLLLLTGFAMGIKLLLIPG